MFERMRHLAVFIGLPLLAAAVIVVHAPWEDGWSSLWLVLAGVVLQAFPVPLTADVKNSLSPVAILVALLVSGPGSAVAVCLGSALVVVVTLPRGQRVLKGTYNTAMFVLPTAVAVSAYAAVAGSATGPGAPIEFGPWMPAIVVALVAYDAVNLTLLSLAIWATEGPAPRATLPSLLASAWSGPVFSTGFAMIAYVVFVEAGLGGLALLLVPLVSARRSMAGVEAQRQSLDRAVRSLVRLVEVKDEYTRGHAERVADLSDRVAARLGMSAEERYWIRIGAVLHDVGKAAIPLAVLNKPGSFTELEYCQMKQHPDLGADLLEHVDALAPAVPLVRQHHERPDGRGYPRGLRGDEVPLATRVVSAVDSWDAMTTDRPYRKGLPVEVAVSELRTHSGTQFDAAVVAQLIAEVAPEFVEAPEEARHPAAGLAAPSTAQASA